ncbi:MAG: alpha/beta hydrolase [Pseudoflavonifractor sp.]|nr:alpha/beta hydrolase [Alloprevotella sp.]MCM1116095.1 alpha/beta hydrolase [Pseudoflavonifractor sp.]
MLQSIEIDNMKVAYEVAGQGTPLILMHGWGCDHSTVASVAATASLTNTVYSLDLPGFGESDEPTRPWTPEDYAAMLRAFVTALGIKRPTLAGHSYGGRVAIVYGATYPDEVDRLILIDAAGVKPRHGLKWHWKVGSFKTGKWLLNTFLGKEKAAPVIERWRNKRGSADYRAASPMMKATMSASVNEDLCHYMPSIKAPTLLMWGEKDTATPLADARKMERLIPDAGIVTFIGAGHYSFLDAPAHFAAVLAEFLNPSPKE